MNPFTGLVVCMLWLLDSMWGGFRACQARRRQRCAALRGTSPVAVDHEQLYRDAIATLQRQRAAIQASTARTHLVDPEAVAVVTVPRDAALAPEDEAVAARMLGWLDDRVPQ